MKKVLFILCFILLGMTNLFAANYSHIRMGLYLMTPITSSDQTFIANHYDVIVFSQTTSHDLTTMLTANPNIEIYNYLSGNTKYQWSDNTYTSTHASWETWLDWCIANEKDHEKGYWHYYYDKTFTSYFDTYTIVSGYGLGLVPGYDGGTATIEANSRLPGSPSFVVPGTVTKSISTIVGVAGTVTVTTTTNHLLYTTNRITISGTTNYNGSFNITRTGATTFTFLLAGDIAQETSGTVTHNALRGWYINYHNTEYSDYMIAQMTSGLIDSVGNKVNGYYFDSITNQLTYYGVMDFTKEIQCIADGGTGDVPAWLRGKIMTWLDRIRVGTIAFLEGTGKTARVTVNADHISYVGDTAEQYHELYENASSGPDLGIIEAGLTPNSLVTPSLSEPKLKRVYDDMVTYGKRFIWEMSDYGKIPYDADQIIVNWTNYSGYIWYTDDLATTIPIHYFQVGSGTATTIVNSLGDLTSSGKIYFDSSTGRHYIWLTGNIDPTGTLLIICGGDKLRHWGLALYYCFGRYGDYGYYFPWDLGATYSKVPSPTKWEVWLPSIEYDIGQPSTGGLDYNGSLGNDVWGNSRAGSNRAYVFWQGNDSTGESGKWSSDWETSLSSTHKVYARKLDNGYAFFRMRISSPTTTTIADGTYTQPVTFTLPFQGRILRADNTLASPSTQITIRQGEGIILITNFGQTPFYGITSGGASFR